MTYGLNAHEFIEDGPAEQVQLIEVRARVNGPHLAGARRRTGAWR